MKTPEQLEMVRAIPLDRLMLETGMNCLSPLKLYLNNPQMLLGVL
jgi:hypothetical protein